MTGGSFATWSKAPIEVRLPPSPRTGKKECYLPGSISEMALRLLEKDTVGV